MSAGNKKVILLVEDDAIIALAEKRDLEKYGYKVITASSGENAIEKFRENPSVDLILMDIDLGSGISGPEATIILLRERDVPVLFLSNHTESEIVEKTEKITSYGYVVKNSGITVLDASIKMAFKLFEANKKISETETLLKASIESPKDMIILSIDKNYNYLYFNSYHKEASYQVYGVTLTIGDNLLEGMTNEEDAKKAKQNFDRTLRGESHVTIQEYGDRERLFFETHYNPIRNNKNEIIGASAFSSDITNRVKVEEALLERERMLNEAQQLAHIGSWSWDIEKDEIKWSKELYSMVGLNPEFPPPNYANLSAFYTKESWKVLSSAVEKAILDGKAYELELDMVRSDGEIRHTNTRGKGYRNQSGKIIRLYGATQDITDQKNAAVKTIQLSKAIEQSPASIVITDTNGIIQYANPKFTEVTGYTLEEAIGKSPRILKSGYTSENEYKELWHCILSGVEWRGVFYNRKKNGDFYWESGLVAPIKNEEGKVINFLAIKEDITARKLAEEAMSELNQFNKEIIQSAQDGLIVYDLDMRYLEWNPFMEKFTGKSSSEVIGKQPLEVFPFLEETGVLGNIKKALAGEIVTTPDFYFTIPNSNVSGWAVDTNSPIRNIKGEIIGVMGTVRDITERKIAENALKESESKYQFIVENTTDILWIMNGDFKFEYVSPTVFNYLGYTVEEHMNQKLDDFLTPQSVSYIRNEFQQGMINLMKKDFDKLRNHPEMEVDVVKKDKTICPSRISMSIIRDEEYRIIKIRGITSDLTQRKIAENALKSSEEKFRTLYESTSDAVMLLTEKGFFDCNTATLNMFGCKSKEEFCSKHPADLSPTMQPDGTLSTKLAKLQIEIALEKGSLSFEWVHRRTDTGEEFPAEVLLNRMVLDGAYILQAVVRDITDRKKSEIKIAAQNIMLQNKNSELEQFAFITSHDLQEPLNTLVSISELIKDDFKGKLNEQADTYLDFIVQSSARMQVLVKGLAEYSQIGKEKNLATVDCNQLMKDVLADLMISIKNSEAKIIVKDLPKLNAYPTELRLLFQNLIGNALKFRKKGVAPEIIIAAKKQKGGWLFSVKDNGIGIDKKYQDKIFAIFKRLHNRNEYEGTGIGLAHCKKIVELHEGQIWVDSFPGQGSTFYFSIPKL